MTDSEIVRSEDALPVRLPNSAYPEYAAELASMPAEHDLSEHLSMLNLLSREAGARVKHRDGHAFRSSVFEAVDELGEMLSVIVLCYNSGDQSSFHNTAGQMAAKVAELSQLAEEGVADLAETDRFFKKTEAVCKRVEKMEELKTGRMGVMKEQVVMKLLDSIPQVLNKYLPADRARAAWSDLMEGFKGGRD